MHPAARRPFTPRPSWPALACAALLACGPDKGSETSADPTSSSSGTSVTPGTTGTTGTTTDAPVPTTSAAASSTGDTTGAPAACMCTAFTEVAGGCSEENVWMHVPACPLDLICATVTVECPRSGADLYHCESELVFDEDALTCALTAMRDRTPGRFIVEGTESGAMYAGTTYGVRLRGDELAIVSECRSGEGVGWSARSRPLAAPAHFTGCLALTTAAARHACLLEGLPDAPLLPACEG